MKTIFYWINENSTIVLGTTGLLSFWAAMQFVRATNRPYLVVRVVFEGPTVLVIVIQNYGNRVARNIRLKIVDEEKHRIALHGEADVPISTRQPFLRGFNSLGPGEQSGHSYFFPGTVWESNNENLLLNARLSYSRGKMRSIFKFRDHVTLYFSDFDGRLIKQK